MTNNFDRYGSLTATIILTLLFSAATVAGAIGPVVNGSAAPGALALNHASGKASQFLA